MKILQGSAVNRQLKKANPQRDKVTEVPKSLLNQLRHVGHQYNENVFGSILTKQNNEMRLVAGCFQNVTWY